MAEIRVNPNLARDLLAHPAATRLVEQLRDATYAAADADAPHRTGHYERALVRDPVTRDRHGLVTAVRDRDFKALWVEFGTAHTPARRVLGRATAAAARLLGRSRP